MTDVETLFLVLGALYLVESGVWLGAGARVVESWFGRHFRPQPAEGHWANDRGGFHFAPIPPTGVLAFSEIWPISISEDGVLGFAGEAPGARLRPPATERFVKFDSGPTFASDGATILADGTTLAKTVQPALAGWLAGVLRELGATPHGERGAALDRRLAVVFDRTAAEARWQEARRHVERVAAPTTALFLQTFVVGPVLYFAYRDRPWIFQALFLYVGAFWFFWWWSAIEFYLGHRTLYPTRRAERWRYAFEAFAIPTAAMRGASRLAKGALGAWHPLTVASVLCPREAAAPLFRQWLRELQHPLAPFGEEWPPELHAVEAEHRSRMRRHVELLAQNLGVELAELTRPPVRWDGAATQWCPRCEREFSDAAADCENCGGLQLVRFDAGDAGAADLV